MAVQNVENSGFQKLFTVIHSFSLKSLEENQESYTEELVSIKAEHRKEEKKWMSEKEFLLRKIQFVQHYGTGFPTNDQAYFTDQRAGARKGGEMKSHRDLQKLNVSCISFLCKKH